jgi:hypothetical protein
MHSRVGARKNALWADRIRGERPEWLSAELWTACAIAVGGSPISLGQSVELIIPEYLRAAHRSGFDAAMRNGVLKLQGRPTLTRALHKSGSRLYVEMTFAVVKGEIESEVLGSVAMARDVTERVERERAARHSS